MAGRVKLSQLEHDVRWQADQIRAELRHTPEDLRRVISQSVQRFREKVSDNGNPYYLESHSGLIPSGPATDPNDDTVHFEWSELDISAVDPVPVRIYGIDVRYSNWTYKLEQIEFLRRNEYQDVASGLSAPVAFFAYNETTVAIVPPTSQPFQYTMWYLPEIAQLRDDDDEFNPCVPGADQWVVWDVMHKICMRDHYMEKIPFVASERENVWIDILKRISSHSRAGTTHRLDTKGMRERGLLARYFGWRF